MVDVLGAHVLKGKKPPSKMQRTSMILFARTKKTIPSNLADRIALLENTRLRPEHSLVSLCSQGQLDGDDRPPRSAGDQRRRRLPGSDRRCCTDGAARRLPFARARAVASLILDLCQVHKKLSGWDTVMCCSSTRQTICCCWCWCSCTVFPVTLWVRHWRTRCVMYKYLSSVC